MLIQEAPVIDQELILQRAYAALSTAFESWYALSLPDPEANSKTVYERIELGKAFVKANPDDERAASLLTTLTAQAVTAERAYLARDAEYRAVSDAS